MKKTPKVILLIETTHAYGRGLIRGIAQYSRHHGPWSFYREAPFYGKQGQSKIRMSELKKINADGIIVREPEHIEDFLSLKIPIITSPSLIHPKIPTILTSADKIGILAAEHLLERGFKHFAYCGFEALHWSVHRHRSFMERIQKADFQTDYFFGSVKQISSPSEKQRRRLADWLIALPKPVGIMACNDDMGRTLLEACKSAGIPVPQQIAVVGVDDDSLTCELTDPPLSSVALHSEKAGYEAAQLLDRLMQGEKMKGQIIPHDPSHVMCRQSTDILAVEDPDVAKALVFIRSHFKEPISVENVSNEVAVSSRNLYTKFMDTLGHSVHREIQKERIRHICTLLAESDLSIQQITLDMGFTGIEHISRYFYKEKGMSLREFRKKFGR
ncbi:MAG: DNA-binding transcriptional regulator [Anaerohalosphaeraceae bacterium]